MRALPLAFVSAVVVGATMVPAASAVHSGQPRNERDVSDCAPLRPGTPAEAGLDPTPIEEALEAVRSSTTGVGAEHPLFPGAVVVLVHDGIVTTSEAAGHALRYADGDGTELPVAAQIPTSEDTIFDLASLSKLFTSIVIMQQVEQGRIRLDRPVAEYLPEFATAGKDSVTVRQLLTHTSGLPPFLLLWRDWPDVPSRLHASLTAELQAEPGSAYIYSDLNMIALAVLAERVTGRSLPDLVRTGITEPLGMIDTGYLPEPAETGRIAATEFQSEPPRGMVHGEVHDENAWSLNGTAGHAGVFGTAGDLAILGQTMLNEGCYDGRRILRPGTVRQMLTDHNAAFPENPRGLGFELNQSFYMGELAGPDTAGHTGYTGTSLVIDRANGSIAILLTNRVHPSRDRGSINPARVAVADGLAAARLSTGQS
ncbi:CubicO group peptidase (beta-lactamase class C family) [Actinoalloteichus hoggarensis]|uniref:D-alanyl-D-alanine-carboxypeptidase/endopeptidase AmpH n=1 Tax=Actinoalloteichus hoggarensis TaxID=1470176 RepID=A0A221VWK4_9PSEU|nr:serine hydrolase domain-containing protein [Actinoalloteichus hoggarensis]ASO17930.1 D-alanyl-D-alanine-carboxypeptidase/endopeptidase AmpH precursor [Actinoalloteichus hoggarensis]MBB5924342.1 CubicO group peptidase (beta-lactamase class C family) [Actinoalloteichus hoggarensis]